MFLEYRGHGWYVWNYSLISVNTLSSTADFVCVGVVKVLSPDLQYYFIILLLFYLNSTIKL